MGSTATIVRRLAVLGSPVVPSGGLKTTVFVHDRPLSSDLASSTCRGRSARATTMVSHFGSWAVYVR